METRDEREAYESKKWGSIMKKNYYLKKDKQTGEILYLEYDKIKGYPVTPKTRIEDAIDVHKIIFVSPSLQEKLIEKKIEIKLRALVQKLEEYDTTDTGSSSDVQNTIMEAERLRMNIIQRYIHYLGNTYGSFYLSKIQVIIQQLKICLYQEIRNEEYRMISNLDRGDELYYLDEEEQKKGRGR